MFQHALALQELRQGPRMTRWVRGQLTSHHPHEDSRIMGLKIHFSSHLLLQSPHISRDLCRPLCDTIGSSLIQLYIYVYPKILWKTSINAAILQEVFDQHVSDEVWYVPESWIYEMKVDMMRWIKHEIENKMSEGKGWYFPNARSVCSTRQVHVHFLRQEKVYISHITRLRKSSVLLHYRFFLHLTKYI